MKRILALVILFGVLWVLLSAGIHALTRNNTLGSDFFIFWQAGRALFFEGANPYSIELAEQSQLSIIKRLASEGEVQLGFANPPYAFIAILPLLYLPFEWASAVWIAFLILIFLVGGMVALPHARRWVVPTFLLFYPTFFGLVLGNFAVLLSTGLLIYFGTFLKNKIPGKFQQILLGILMAWLTIKPQFLWLYLIFFIIFALRYHLWWFISSLFLSLTILLIFSFLVLPEWPLLWVDSFSRTAYDQAYPVLTVLLTLLLPISVAIPFSIALIIASLIVTIRLVLRWWHGRLSLLSLFAWLGLIAILIPPRGPSYEHLAYLLPLVVWAGYQFDWRSMPANLFWWGSLAVSWTAFVISKQPGASESATEWPLLFNILWVVWMLYQDHQLRRRMTGDRGSNSVEIPTKIDQVR